MLPSTQVQVEKKALVYLFASVSPRWPVCVSNHRTALVGRNWCHSVALQVLWLPLVLEVGTGNQRQGRVQTTASGPVKRQSKWSRNIKKDAAADASVYNLGCPFKVYALCAMVVG